MQECRSTRKCFAEPSRELTVRPESPNSYFRQKAFSWAGLDGNWTGKIHNSDAMLQEAEDGKRKDRSFEDHAGQPTEIILHECGTSYSQLSRWS